MSKQFIRREFFGSLTGKKSRQFSTLLRINCDGRGEDPASIAEYCCT